MAVPTMVPWNHRASITKLPIISVSGFHLSEVNGALHTVTGFIWLSSFHACLTLRGTDLAAGTSAAGLWDSGLYNIRWWDLVGWKTGYDTRPAGQSEDS